MRILNVCSGETVTLLAITTLEQAQSLSEFFLRCYPRSAIDINPPRQRDMATTGCAVPTLLRRSPEYTRVCHVDGMNSITLAGFVISAADLQDTMLATGHCLRCSGGSLP